MRIRIDSLLLALLIAPACGFGQTRLEVGHGWEGKERPGRWNPLFVRASEPLPRDVIIEFNSPTDAGFGTTFREHVAIGPGKGTFELYAPSHYSPSSQSVLVLRDAETGRAIAQSPAHLIQTTTRPAQIGPSGIFIGISGKPAELQSVSQSGVADAGYLPPRLLPRSAIGYDGIECLFLNQPDLDELEIEQQRAILDWVRAGGRLLFAPSDRPLPDASPVTGALPCKVGDVAVIDLPPEVLAQAGIPARFARQSTRQLTPSPGATALKLFTNDNVVAYSGRYGLGRIMVVPIDLAALEFDPAALKQKVSALWRPILNDLTGGPPPEPKRQYSAPFYGYESESEDQEREGAALGTLCDFIAGAGSSTPRTLPLALLAILFVIGPIDSIVLFALRSRPWRWATAAGWVGFLVAGTATLIWHVRSGEVACRTVRVIDQVDDSTVATADLLGVWSSCPGKRLPLHSQDQGQWWQPAIPGLVGPQDVYAAPDLGFHETDRGDAPEPIATDCRRPRFLRADRVGAGAPILRAVLSLQGPSNARRLIGTVRNVSGQSLRNLRIRTQLGVALLPIGADGTLAAGTVVNVNVPVVGETFAPQQAEGQYQSYGYFGSKHLDRSVAEGVLWAVAPDLSGRRSLRIEQVLGGSLDFCCLYAESVNPPAPASVDEAALKPGQSFQWVRALVKLTASDSGSVPGN